MVVHTMKRIGVVLTCWNGLLTGFAAAQESPEAVLARVGTVYQQARTYRDTGQSSTVIIKDGRRQEVVHAFNTAFVRPNAFRFEFTSGTGELAQRFVVWTEKGPDSAQRWWSLQEQPLTDKLGPLLAGANTLSGGASLVISRLLLPDLLNRPGVLAVREPKNLGETNLDGTACIVIQGISAASPNEVITYWIGKSDSLLRKISRSSDLGELSTIESCTFQPRLDEAIAPETFRFAPPR